MHKNRWNILQVVNLGTFMSMLDIGIVNVALPTMAAQFSVSLAQIQWVVTSYLLTMIVLLPLMGKVSDAIGRDRIYSGGFLVFGIGSLLAVFSGSVATLIVARCIQGVGATMIMANSQAMVRQIFPDSERGRALGFNAVVISIGMFAGPGIGGLLLEVIGWEGLFLMNVPLGLIGLLVGLRLFPRIRQPVVGRLDMFGMALLACSTVLFVLSAERIAGKGFSERVLLQLGVSALLLIGFALYEQRIGDGMMDRELFGNRIISLGNVSAFTMHLAQMAALIPVTFFLQRQLGFAPWLVGVMLCVQPLMMGIVAPLAGTYRDRHGAFAPLLAGPAIAAFSLAVVVFAPSGGLGVIGGGEGSEVTSVATIVMLTHLALFGVAMGLFQAANNAEMMSAAPVNKASHAGSMLALIRNLGTVTGTGLAAAFVGMMGAEGATDALADETRLRALFAVCFILCVGITVLAMFRARPSKVGHMHNVKKKALDQ